MTLYTAMEPRNFIKDLEYQFVGKTNYFAQYIIKQDTEPDRYTYKKDPKDRVDILFRFF